jgi:putative MATE family efflux protein
MLEAPIASTLLRLAWPNTLMMVAQSATGLIESWYLAKLGTDVLAGIAVVTPILMLMQNMSHGAIGGGISSAIARALGSGRKAEANDLARHAVALTAALGVILSIVLIAIGPTLFRALGADGAAMDAAVSYATVVFAGMVLLWVMGALASVIRGTGNMLVPGAVICGGALLLIPISPCLIFGVGPMPPLGVAGGAWALLLYYAAGTLILGCYCVSGRNPARLTWGGLRWAPLRDILKVGGLSCLNPLLTNALIALSGAVVGAYAGTAALAGYGTAARLEYVLIPVAFGFGGPMIAMVASNIGAGQVDRARRIALVGSGMAFLVAETIGLAAAAWPGVWLGLFDSEPQMLDAGVRYLRTVGPFYGCFALGFSLYFASQGAGRLKWPLLAGALRLLVSVGVGWIAIATTGSLQAFFAASAAAMFLYGTVVLWSVGARTWFTHRGATSETAAAA